MNHVPHVIMVEMEMRIIAHHVNQVTLKTQLSQIQMNVFYYVNIIIILNIININVQKIMNVQKNIYFLLKKRGNV